MKKGYFGVFLAIILGLSLGLAACAETPKIVPPLPNTSAATPLITTASATATPAIAAPTLTTTPELQVIIPATATPDLPPTEPPPPTPVVAPTPTSEVARPVTVAQVPTSTPASVGNSTPARTIAPTLKTTAAPVAPTATAVPKPTFTIGPTTVNSPPYTGALSEVGRGRTGKKQVALTLDAGAGAQPFPKMLSALSLAGVRITFFLTGQWAQQNPGYVQQIVAAGHEVANHTWSHPDLTTISNEAIRDEVGKAETILSRISGRSTKPLWRAPYGSRDNRVLQVLNEMGYRSIMWTIDSLDSVGEPKSAQFLIDRITKQTNAQLDGEIILMHIGNATTAEALPAILKNLKERGFQIVTVSELLS